MHSGREMSLYEWVNHGHLHTYHRARKAYEKARRAYNSLNWFQRLVLGNSFDDAFKVADDMLLVNNAEDMDLP